MAPRFHVPTLGLAVWIASSVSAPVIGCAEGEALDPDLPLNEAGVKHGAGGKGGSMPSLPTGGSSGTSDPSGSGGAANPTGSGGSGGSGNVADAGTGSGGAAGQSGSAGSAGAAGSMPMDAAIIPPDAPLAKGIVVFYKAVNTAQMDDTIGFYFQVVNNGTTAVPIAALKIRYYFTDELNGAGKTPVYESFATNYPVEGPSRAIYLTLTKETVTRVTLANSYLEFTVNTPDQLQPNYALTMQVAYAAPGGQPLDETNDYSANLAQNSAYAQTKKIVVFQGTTVIAGDAPPY